jgi:hypothetical protein
MVAVFEGSKASALYVGDIESVHGPLTLVVLNGRQVMDPAAIFGVRPHHTGELDGEPTWEDAAWQ